MKSAMKEETEAEENEIIDAAESAAEPTEEAEEESHGEIGPDDIVEENHE